MKWVACATADEVEWCLKDACLPLVLQVYLRPYVIEAALRHPAEHPASHKLHVESAALTTYYLLLTAYCLLLTTYYFITTYYFAQASC